MLGLGARRPKVFEMTVGDIVENDAAAEEKKIALALAYCGLDVLTVGHEIVAGAVEIVL